MTITAYDERPWVSEIRDQVTALDRAISTAVATTPTPTLDRVLVRLSNAADRSRLWLATAGVVALVGGPRGRRAAVEAVASIGLASASSNLLVKSLAHRRRPPSPDGQTAVSREVRRPTSSSFPSGHSASAFAFASTMGEAVPATWAPLHVAASFVAYSRIHTGVHYPSDVAAGTLLGAMSGWTVRRLARHLSGLPRVAGRLHAAHL